MVSPKQRQLPAPILPHFPPWAAEAAPPSVLLSERTAAGLCPGGLAGGPVLGTDRAGASRLVQVRFLQTHQFRPSRNGTIIYSVAFVVHMWVRVKYGPVLFTGGDVNCAALAEGPNMHLGAVDYGDSFSGRGCVAAVWIKASR